MFERKQKAGTHGRKEARLITVAAALLAGSGVASAVSPAIESTLNLWVGLPAAVIGGGALLVVAAKEAWSWALTEWEIRREPKPREDAKEVEWRA